MAYVPQVKGLRVHQILNEARKHWRIDDYLPEMKDDKLPNREFVVNIGNTSNILIQVVNTLIPDQLQAMVDKAMDEREEKYTKKKNISMRVLPEFKRLFDDTKEISSKIYIIIYPGHNGRFHQLVRNSDQRRRNREERVRTSESEMEVKLGMYQRDKIIENLQNEVKEFEAVTRENDKNSEILSRLFECGIIDAEGRFIDRKEKQDEN